MITTEITIRRGSGLWGGVSPDTVKRYREELEKLKKELNDFDFIYGHNLLGSEELMKSLKGEIDEEIKYCLFYDEYRNREASDSNLGKWVFMKQEDIKPEYDWLKVPGEQWTKTNGRIKAIIQFDRTSIMVKITLEYKNDSEHLKFYEASYRSIKHGEWTRKPPTAHLKSEDSINAKVQELKNEADTFLEDNLNPLYSQYEIDLLKQLLHLKEG